MKLRSSFCVDFPQKAQSACFNWSGLNEKSADFSLVNAEAGLPGLENPAFAGLLLCAAISSE
jgi:hypothetical protein